MKIARPFIIVGIALAIAIAWTQHKQSATGSPYHHKRHVFINTTKDHSHDDSIQMTILANYERAGVQNAVVITDDIPGGKTLEDWAPQLYKDLNLGRQTDGKAILYIYVPSQKKLKIEVGYALEGVMPDANVKPLEEAAKSFTYSNRIQDFWADLINTINVVIHNKQSGIPTTYDFAHWKYLSGGAGVQNSEYVVNSEQLKKEFRELQTGDNRFQPQKSAAETLELYLTSLKEGIGDTNLPLISTGSNFYRMHTPLNRALLTRMWQMYQDASPFVIEVVDDQAIATFKKGNPVLPIFLFRDKSGNWLVHEPYSYTLFNRFENSMDVFQTQPVVPSAKVFERTRLGNNIVLWGAKPYDPRPLQNDELFEKVDRLEKQSDEKSLYELAELYYFELGQYEKAAELYEQAFKIKIDPRQLWTYMGVVMASGRTSDFVKVNERLLKYFPDDARLKKNNDFYQETFKFKDSEWDRGPI